MTVPIPLENDVEVGETIPPMTAHVSHHSFIFSSTNASLTVPGCERLATDVESQCRVRRRRRVGLEQDENRLPKVPAATGSVSASPLADLSRFFIHKAIEQFAAAVAEQYGRPGERAILFPSHAVAARCQEFFARQAPELDLDRVRILDLVPVAEGARSKELAIISPRVSAVLFPEDKFKIAKTFWQHSGDGVSSRRAEYCHSLFSKGALVDESTLNDTARFCKGPRRYQKKTSIDLGSSTNKPNGTAEVQDPTQFVEERFGRNLDLSLTANAKLAVRRRIAGSLTADVGLTEALSLEKDADRMRDVAGFSEDDIYLYPCGMSSIFNAHRNLMATKGPLKSIVYGYGQAHPRKCLYSLDQVSLHRHLEDRREVRSRLSILRARLVRRVRRPGEATRERRTIPGSLH